MESSPVFRAAALLMLVLWSFGGVTSARADPAATAPSASATPEINPDLPTLFIIGDSTVRNTGKGMVGWGTPVAQFFDPAKVNVLNRAMAGRSSRSFYTEGRWDKVLAEMKAGDFLLIQFGHNDVADPKKDTKGRASVHSAGDETVEITDPQTGKTETVHSYGWYLRKFVADAKAKGVAPVILSPIPHNDWADGKVKRTWKEYEGYCAEVAQSEHVPYVDLSEIIARRYDQLGQEKVKEFFPFEHTHSNAAGAQINAESVVAGLKGLNDFPLVKDLSEKGEQIPAYAGGAEAP